MYAIIDIETTGLSPANEKITEIAVLVSDGQKIVEEFVSLINPERPIPYFITGLTGITNEMVSVAPKFYEIAKKLIEITDHRIFVAHNVDFDYHFIRAEFASLGFEFKRHKLCTVKLSKKLIPGKNSYSLGKLTAGLGIQINGRHRAAGDALATAELFHKLLNLDLKSKPLVDEMIFHSGKGLNPAFNKTILDKIPEKTGVYYFYDEESKLIYIGKSINIHARVLQHLNNNSTKKAIEMKGRITDISYEITGSELVALLLESDGIKKNMPLYNRSQRRNSFHFGLYSFTDEQGYLNFAIRPNSGSDVPHTSFPNIQGAKNYLEQLLDRFHLCQKFCGLYQSTGSCFNYGIKSCFGACCGKEPADVYNERAKSAKASMDYRFDSFFIIDEGRVANEKSVIYIHRGKYKGFGYIDTEFYSNNTQDLVDCIKGFADNRDIQIIIKGYLGRKPGIRIIPVEEA
jgi:DNA polymerase III subunit epsilon